MKEKIGNLIESLLVNKFYIAIWLIALVNIIAINQLTDTTESFVGVTETKEININSKHPVVIKDLNVIPGQEVKKGTLLVQLERPDLNIKMSEVMHELEGIRSERAFAIKLNQGLKSLTAKDKNQSRSTDPRDIKIKQLVQELKFLEKERQSLYIFSEFDGYIGSVNFKKRESVSPFSTIITLNRGQPDLVRGYIHENVSNSIEIGTPVIVASSANPNKTLSTRVANVGNRILEFPARFQRESGGRLWGREIVLVLPSDNEFLLGEKVFIKSLSYENSDLFKDTAYASNSAQVFKEKDMQKLEFPNSFDPKTRIDISGLTYLPDLKKYLVISDDNYQNKPILYLMNEDLKLDESIIQVGDLDSIEDMESITVDPDGSVYVMSSQSYSKKGLLPKERTYLIKLVRDDLKFRVAKKIRLRTLLKKFADKNPGSDWVKAIRDGARREGMFNPNVQGMFIFGDDMYLGLRTNYLSDDHVVILKLSGVRSLDQSTDGLEVAIWKKIKIPGKRSKISEGITGMLVYENKVLLTTASNDYRVLEGRVLMTPLDSENNQVTEIAKFDQYLPQGLAINTDRSAVTVGLSSAHSKMPFVTEVKIKL